MAQFASYTIFHFVIIWKISMLFTFVFHTHNFITSRSDFVSDQMEHTIVIRNEPQYSFIAQP